jgi:hypothetical protein
MGNDTARAAEVLQQLLALDPKAGLDAATHFQRASTLTGAAIARRPPTLLSTP